MTLILLITESFVSSLPSLLTTSSKPFHLMAIGKVVIIFLARPPKWLFARISIKVSSLLVTSSYFRLNLLRNFEVFVYLAQENERDGVV